ncbi:hypothetical protein TcCL_Unassigned01368 [Trypanosoma cruzi]|uniref:Uncharacterized protein n=1 Tax=Trypanosoma cruzi (strain CL Brener) TaxID=353153 RepID=Q4CVZ5_TRYCC|nr:uncharacterized protein Tc00.1047053506217.30 [Trypanosoma cruzi]EAN84447.1 hypothetical protein Tc00.1047053506217.30 [Trypanosoma cruzi]RNC35731.1 hypothetical protein TcCL_Unassigned01368 [Trypanosoma cruzi]|eukprot:XP_806298.1 hypothetical protein Tc00.1047053506217.30 [Trypanosoma cruzi strain CL Brener]
MNRSLRKATRGRLFFLLRCTSEPPIRGRGRSVCRISLNSMSFYMAIHTHMHAVSLFALLWAEDRDAREKCGLCQHVTKSFLGGVATVMYVLAGRNGMGEEQRASNSDRVRGNAQ